MAQNHTVEIRITASNMASPEMQAVVRDLQRLGTAADQVSMHVGQSGQAARSSGSGFLDMASKVGMVTTGVFAAGQIVSGFAGTAARATMGLLQLNAGLETTQTAFTQLTGSASTAQMLMEQLRDLARATPFEFPELAKSAQLLMAFGDTAEEVIPHLTIIGDTVSAFGGGASEIDRVTRALGQMASKGKVSAEEMNQLSEGGVNGFRILSEELGVSEAALRKLSEQGKLLAEDALPALYAGLEKTFGGGMQRQAETFNGLWSSLNDTFNMTLATVSKPFFDIAKESLKELNEYTQSVEFEQKVAAWTESAQGFAENLRSFIADEGPGMVATLREVGEVALITGQMIGTAAGFVVELKQAWDGLPAPVRGAATSLAGMLDTTSELSFMLNKFKEDGPRAMSAFDQAVTQAYLNIEGVSIIVDQQGTVLREAAKLASEYHGVLITGEDIAKGYAITQDGVTIATDRFVTAILNGTEAQVLAEKTSAAAAAAQDAYVASIGRSAEMAGLANEANSEYFHSLELGSGDAAELAFRLDKLSEAQDALAGAYQIGLQIQSDYTAQGSEYASQAATIEKALEVQKERLDAGAISQDEYNRYLERGTQAIERYEGGVQDATLTAADYAIQNAELMRIQDEIQSQFPGLVQGSAEYNQKLEEAALKAGISQQAIDDMKGSNGNLASVIADELVPSLQDLINKILELDGKKASVTVETNFISTGGAGPGAVGFTEFAEGGLVTRPTLALIGEAGPEVVVPLNQLPASAKADLLGNQQGQGNITLGQAGWLPFVEGLVGDLDAAAQAFSAEGLGHAQLFSETASQGVSLMMDGLGLLLALSETPPRYGPDIEAGIGALVELSWKVAHYTGEAAKGLVAQDGFLEGGKAFSDAAAEGIDTLAGGLELLQSLSASDAIWNPEIEERLKGLVELSWKAAYFMGEAAKGLVAQDGFLVGATVFGEAASASLGTLSDALSFLSDVSEVAADSALVTDDIGMRLVQLADVARLAADEVLRAGATWVGEVNPSLALFASGASDSLGLLGDVLGMLESLHEAEGGALSFGTDFADLFGQMGDVARLAADAIAATSDEWQASVNPQIEAFREAAGDSLSLMADVGRSLDSILKFGEEDRPEDLQGLSAEMARTVSIMVQAVEIINAEWQARGAPNITEFADGAGKAVSLMSGVAGAFEAIAGSSAISVKQVVVFKRNFEVAFELIGELADLAEPYQDDAERFLEIIESIAEAIGTAADIISTVAGEGAGTAAQAAKGLASVGQSMGTYDGSSSGLAGVSGGAGSVGASGGAGGGYAAPNVAGSSVGFLDMYGVGGSAGGLATPGNLANSQGVKTWKQYEAWVNDMLAKGYVELVNGQPIFTKKYYTEQLGWIEYHGTLYDTQALSPEQTATLQANVAYEQGTWATGGKKATLPTSPGQRGEGYGKQTLSKADIDAIAKAVEKGAKNALAGAI